MPCGGLVAVVVLGRFSRFRYLVVDGLSKVMGMGLQWWIGWVCWEQIRWSCGRIGHASWWAGRGGCCWGFH